MKIVKIKKVDDWQTRQKWLDSLNKLNYQLEVVLKKMPKEMSNVDKLTAEIKLNQTDRRVDAIRRQLRDTKILEKSI